MAIGTKIRITETDFTEELIKQLKELNNNLKEIKEILYDKRNSER